MGTIINSSLQSQLRERSEPNRAICFARQIWSEGGGHNNPVFEVLVSKLEGLAGWGLGSPAKAAVGHWTVWRSSRALDTGQAVLTLQTSKKLLSLKIPAPGVLLLPQT